MAHIFEFDVDCDDRAKMGVPFVLEHVILANHSSAIHAYNFQRYQRTAAAPSSLPGSVHWWMTLRNDVVQFAGMELNRTRPIITYISCREWSRRMLIKEDHKRLVKELYRLRDEYGWEVNIVRMEEMSRAEQIRIAVPNPRATVIGFLFPEGFAHDYEWTSHALGITHYGFWGASSFTSPDTPPNLNPGASKVAIKTLSQRLNKHESELVALRAEVRKIRAERRTEAQNTYDTGSESGQSDTVPATASSSKRKAPSPPPVARSSKCQCQEVETNDAPAAASGKSKMSLQDRISLPNTAHPAPVLSGPPHVPDHRSAALPPPTNAGNPRTMPAQSDRGDLSNHAGPSSGPANVSNPWTYYFTHNSARP
ncbi:hypothetical protein C8R47DRAFT_1228204 [Mycena vitilis]|nr:hypothetical protein C8R47DRAFT_1228204 [Mycena vitilis]